MFIQNKVEPLVNSNMGMIFDDNLFMFNLFGNSYLYVYAFIINTSDKILLTGIFSNN